MSCICIVQGASDFTGKKNVNTSEQTVSNHQYINVLIAGGVSGFTGAFTTFFFAAGKKRRQSGQAFPSISELGPRKWVRETFRGSIGNSVLLTPTAVIQQLSDQYWKQQGSANPSNQIAATLFSGAVGGVASTVVENMLLQQQIKKASASQALISLYEQSPTRIFRGMQMIMLREAIFGWCYLSGVVQAGNYAAEHYGARYRMPVQILVGMMGALVSHPFDTTATTMQQHGYTKTRHAVQHLLREPNAIKAFYKGGLMRMGLFTTGIIVVSNTRQAVMNQLQAPPPSS